MSTMRVAIASSSLPAFVPAMLVCKIHSVDKIAMEQELFKKRGLDVECKLVPLSQLRAGQSGPVTFGDGPVWSVSALAA
jgi:hypothetical protein